jgi:uncharacterized membrane protein YqjE
MSAGGGHVLERVRRILRTLLHLLQTRLALVAAETEVFVEGVLNEFLLGLFGILLGMLGLAFLGVGVVMAVGEAHRVVAALAVAVAYGAGSLLCWVVVRRSRRARGRWLHLTTDELQRDLGPGAEEVP